MRIRGEARSALPLSQCFFLYEPSEIAIQFNILITSQKRSDKLWLIRQTLTLI